MTVTILLIPCTLLYFQFITFFMNYSNVSKIGEEKPSHIQKITPFLWFDNQAEQAANFYVSVFKNSNMGQVTRYGKEGYEIHGMDEGSVMTVDFDIENQKFIALNGGPVFKFNEAISFQVLCDSQKELDYYWEKLSEGGDKNAQQCGWLKDKYGVSWQIVPRVLYNLIQDKDQLKSQRVMKAMLQMKKLDIQTLIQAYEKT
jgi:predicted 3-demethylubiquinone-9 3-methyltransferase (glyoxalase superfamily)